MRLDAWTRQVHRWLSIAFTVSVLANIVLVARGDPPAWMYILPLPPLALLMLTGLFLFARPYLAGRRRQQRPSTQE